MKDEKYHSHAAASDYVRQLEIIRKIRDTIQVHDEINLPQICVIGDQSAGKSSFLSRLTGVSFPTAANMCTKAATVVTCHFDKKAAQPVYEMEDLEKRGTYVAVDCTARAIEERQEKMLTSSEGQVVIKDRSINLRVTSAEVKDIILVDLPGIQHAGPAKDAINSMIEANIQKPETLIVIVSEAKQDFELTKAIETAKKYDPNQERTIRILSKFDNFDTPDTRLRAITIIKEGLLPTQADVSSVVSRSLGPHAVISNDAEGKLRKDAQAHAEEERQLVDEYGLPSSRAGIESLKGRLQPLFADLVKKNLPTLKQAVSIRLAETEKQLDSVGRSSLSSSELLFKCHRSLQGKFRSFEQRLTNTAFLPFKVAISERKEEITMEFATQNFEANSFQCILFQGGQAFDDAILQIRLLWKPSVDIYIKTAEECTLESLHELRGDDSTKAFGSLISAIDAEYQDYMRSKVFPDFEQACRQCLHESSFFGTTNHYFDAKFLTDELCPPSLIASFRSKAKALWNDREKTPQHSVSPSYRQISLDRLQGCLEEAAAKTAQSMVHQDLVDNQKKRLFAAVKAHFDVEKKTFADTILKKTKDILISGHRRWIEQELLRSESIMKAASEDPHICSLRIDLQGQLARLLECMSLLHDVPLLSTTKKRKRQETDDEAGTTSDIEWD